MGIVRHSSSAWAASLLHMAPKASGGWRPCSDHHRLYPVTHTSKFPVQESDILKTAVITPFSLFEFVHMLLGMLCDAAQAFQRLMDKVCRGVDFVFIYLDDVLVASHSQREHLTHLHQLFQQLHQRGLVLNLAKCQFD